MSGNPPHRPQPARGGRIGCPGLAGVRHLKEEITVLLIGYIATWAGTRRGGRRRADGQRLTPASQVRSSGRPRTVLDVRDGYPGVALLRSTWKSGPAPAVTAGSSPAACGSSCSA